MRPAPLRYPGAKWSLAPVIAAHFPAHYHYVEPFFGSGAVFFAKDPSGHELINDLDGRVVTFFRVLRERPEELQYALETTPWARDEYEASDTPAADELEEARRFAVRVWQAHASDTAKKTGWKTRGSRQRAGGMSLRWQKVPAQLRLLADRLMDAEIENRPALEVIGRFATPDTLVYADPPYLPETRTQKMYAHEMTVEEHVALLDALNAHPGPVVLSGYDSDLYAEKLHAFRQVAVAAPKVEKGAKRTEVLWVRDAI